MYGIISNAILIYPYIHFFTITAFPMACLFIFWPHQIPFSYKAHTLPYQSKVTSLFKALPQILKGFVVIGSIHFPFHSDHQPCPCQRKTFQQLAFTSCWLYCTLYFVTLFLLCKSFRSVMSLYKWAQKI